MGPNSRWTTYAQEPTFTMFIPDPRLEASFVLESADAANGVVGIRSGALKVGRVLSEDQWLALCVKLYTD